ncbi:MAG TPA: hypothetical protein IAA33_01065 [Candidatus Helicobacter avicola]|nr:hypothetical protein [Candidatus Helicobacter avicola]
MSVRESIVSQAETLKKGLSEANPKQAKGAVSLVVMRSGVSRDLLCVSDSKFACRKFAQKQ